MILKSVLLRVRGRGSLGWTRRQGGGSAFSTPRVARSADCRPWEGTGRSHVLPSQRTETKTKGRSTGPISRTTAHRKRAGKMANGLQARISRQRARSSAPPSDLRMEGNTIPRDAHAADWSPLEEATGHHTVLTSLQTRGPPGEHKIKNKNTIKWQPSSGQN